MTGAYEVRLRFDLKKQKLTKSFVARKAKGRARQLDAGHEC